MYTPFINKLQNIFHKTRLSKNISVSPEVVDGVLKEIRELKDKLDSIEPRLTHFEEDLRGGYR